ncbi:MAG: DNA-directed RNA polymerase subunit omega [Rickettsiales bacterium]|nr:DNA-directed RNA polymerase subunit omega [Rickettsiales bacterium]
MARTTNSDTLKFVDSRYELGILATQRVRDLNGGIEPVVPAGRDKETVVALREIASGKLDVADLRHEFVQTYKSAPIADGADASIESVADDPLLKELDAELEGAILETPMTDAEMENEMDDSLADENDDTMDAESDIAAIEGEQE